MRVASLELKKNTHYNLCNRNLKYLLVIVFPSGQECRDRLSEIVHFAIPSTITFLYRWNTMAFYCELF